MPPQIITRIELSFTNLKGELESLKVFSDGELLRSGNLTKEGSRSRHGDLKRRKICVLALLQCKLVGNDLVLHDDQQWKSLLRTLKDKETDARPAWVREVFCGKLFEFFVEPDEQSKNLIFQHGACERITVLLEGNNIALDDLDLLITYYRTRCINDSRSILTTIVGDARKMKLLRGRAKTVSELTFEEDIGTLIGKYVWYLDWGEVRRLLFSTDDAPAFQWFLIEISRLQDSISSTDALQPLRDYFDGFARRCADVTNRFRHLFSEIDGRLTEIFQDHSDDAKEPKTLPSSLAESVNAIELGLQSWEKSFSTEDVQKQEKSRQRVVELAKHLFEALKQLDLLLIDKRNHCRSSLEELNSKLMLSPRR